MSITWQKWENERLTITKKDGSKQVMQSRKMLSVKTGTMAELTSELCDELGSFALHLFTAKWQFMQFKNLKENLPTSWVLTVADFAENYRCVYQDEISAAYYQYKQATLHPIVSFHHCPDCSEMMTSSYVCISPDLLHDAYAVKQFQQNVKDHLTSTGTEIGHLVQFSDGCAAQYKSKSPFMHLALYESSEERAFFGSRHGKGPCDALGGVVKKAAERYVMTKRGLIRDAKEMFDFANDHLTVDPCHGEDGCHNKRIFFFNESINRSSDLTNEAVTVPNTRQLHAVKNKLNASDPTILARKLSCFCTGCTSMSGNCSNRSHVEGWRTIPLTKPGVLSTKRRRSSVAEKSRKKIKKARPQPEQSRKKIKKARPQPNLRKRTKRYVTTVKLNKSCDNVQLFSHIN